MCGPRDATRRERDIRDQFGELLSTADLAKLLRYGSPQAVRQARARGVFPVPMQQIPGRRGWFATARAVAVYLDHLDPPEVGGREAR